jgi:hypothetical protein
VSNIDRPDALAMRKYPSASGHDIQSLQYSFIVAFARADACDASVPMLTDDSLDVIPGRPEGEPGIPLRNLEIFGFAADAALRNDGMIRQSHNARTAAPRRT